MVPGRSPPVSLNDAVLFPVTCATLYLALEEEARDVPGVCEGHQEEVHLVRYITGHESEGRQKRYCLSTLFKEDGLRMHGLDAGELIAHEELPQGTCSKNFMPSFTRSLAPGLRGVSRPSSLMNSST